MIYSGLNFYGKITITETQTCRTYSKIFLPVIMKSSKTDLEEIRKELEAEAKLNKKMLEDVQFKQNFKILLRKIFYLFFFFIYPRIKILNNLSSINKFYKIYSVKLNKIKEQLLSSIKISNTFKTDIFTENLEKAYKKIYERYNQNLNSENIYI